MAAISRPGSPSEPAAPGGPGGGPGRSRAEALRLACVLLAWLAMSVSACVYVSRYASRIPFKDDLELSLWLDPGAKVPLEWWWQPANEHRIPLPRAIYLALFALT